MPLPRKKSCYACRAAKTRCDLASPRCSRCALRGSQCDYGNTQTSLKRLIRHEVRGTRGYKPDTTNPSADLQRDQAVLGQISIDGSDSSYIPVDETNIDSVFQVPAEKDPLSYVDWSLGQTSDSWWQPDVSGFSPVPQVWSIPTTTSARDSRDDLPWLRQGIDLGPSQNFDPIQPPLDSSNLLDVIAREKHCLRSPNLYPPSPSLNWTPWKGILSTRPGLLMQRKNNLMLTQVLAAKYILGSISSYPDMMLGKSSSQLPPFIHPHCAINDDDCGCADELADRQLPKPLANCVSLLHMYETRTAASTAFVWRSIFAEQERLYKEWKYYDCPTQLAALQAVAIYMLHQSVEGQHNENACLILILAMCEISLKLYTDGLYSPSEERGGIPSWGEWTYIESMRRTGTVLFLMNMLLDINIGFFKPGDCAGMDKTPLPATRELWAAGSRQEWADAYEKSVERRRRKGLLTVGKFREIMARKEVQTEGLRAADDEVKDLGQWSARVDGLGSMILMAAVTASA